MRRWRAGRGRGEGLSAAHLLQEHVLTLARGDAVFHHSWTIHGTAPNETEQKRRGWALHYADARSQWGERCGRSGCTSISDRPVRVSTPVFSSLRTRSSKAQDVHADLPLAT